MLYRVRKSFHVPTKNMNGELRAVAGDVRDLDPTDERVVSLVATRAIEPVSAPAAAEPVAAPDEPEPEAPKRRKREAD